MQDKCFLHVVVIDVTPLKSCTSRHWGENGKDGEGKCDSMQDDRFSGDQGVFTGWQQYVLLAKSLYQHGIADFSPGTVNSSCGKELSRHGLRYIGCIHHHDNHYRLFSPSSCHAMEHYALRGSCTSNVTPLGKNMLLWIVFIFYVLLIYFWQSKCLYSIWIQHPVFTQILTNWTNNLQDWNYWLNKEKSSPTLKRK